MIQRLLFYAGIALVLISGLGILPMILGWLVLAVLAFKTREWGLAAAVFFMPFFHSAGLGANPYFTLKHYHLAAAILLAAEIFRGRTNEWLSPLAANFKELIPLWLMLAVFAFSALMHHEPPGTFLMSANLALVIAGTALIAALPQSSPEGLLQLFFYFVQGSALQAAANLYNVRSGQFIFELDLLYNNQFGMLMTFALFYALTAAVYLRSFAARLTAIVFSFILAAAFLLSCSRTAWLSFGLASIFCVLACRNPVPRRGRSVLAWRIGWLALSGAAAFIILFIASEDVSQRVTHLSQLLDWKYLKFTLSDRQNYGFLGILRAEHLREMKEILQLYPITGIGLAHRVTDFHGSFMVLLGAGGILGFVLYLIFMVRAIFKLCRIFHESRSRRGQAAIAATLASFTAWQLSHLTQTMLVHYSAWFSVVAALIIFRRPPFRELPV